MGDIWQALLNRLYQERQVIKGAPIHFVIAVLIVGGLVVFITIQFVGYHYQSDIESKNQVIETQEQRLSFSNERLAAYEKEFPGRTPEQIAGRINQLESQIDNINRGYWPPLTGSQIESIIKKLRTFKNEKVLLECGKSSCIDLADNFDAIFKSLGWEIERRRTASYMSDSPNIWIFPDNKVTRSLKTAIESETGMEVTINDDTTDRIFFVIGNRYVSRKISQP
jgi:hypothetical protein